jgi:hypothetical protein
MTVNKTIHSPTPAPALGNRIPRSSTALVSLAILTALSARAYAAPTIIIDDFDVPNGGQTISQDGIGTNSSLYNLGGPDLLVC